MARPERPLDPQGGPLAEFAARLRNLREQAGRPGYRELARRSRYAPTTLSDAAGGRTLPSLAVTLAFVAACGGDLTEWEARWQAVSEALIPLVPAEAAAESAQRPYRGLATYEPSDAEWFFGREGLVAELARRLEHRRFFAVFGPSGSGKSSLLRAGLIPAARRGLLAGGNGEDSGAGEKGGRHQHGGWPAVLMTPGAHPMDELDSHRTQIAEAAADGVLVVVDQFEEMFTLCHTAAEREKFVDALLTLAGTPDERTRVVLGVRADFYAECAAYPDLVIALRDAQLLVGAMTATELREAVTRPAEHADLIVEGALVSTVVADVVGQAGALPLMSHALLEAWRRRRGNAVTLAGYRAAGGLDGAVAQTAERVYAELADEQRRAVREVLLRLIEPGDGGDAWRRRVERAEFDTDEGTAVVLSRLTAARLLTLGERTVEIAHEALIRAWPRLRQWLTEDREALGVHRQLTHAAAEWESLARDPGALYRGARLAGAEAMATRDPARLSTRERAFLDASLAAAAHEVAARHRRVRTALTGLTAAVTAVSLLAAFALVQQGQAREERDVAFSRRLAADARSQLDLDPELAVLLALEANRIRATDDADAVLRQAVLDSRVQQVLPVGQAPTLGVAYAPDGRGLATTSEDGFVRLWRWPGRLEPGRPGPGPPAESVLQRGGERMWSPAFSRDGRHLAAAGEDGVVRVWDLRHGTALAALRGHRGQVWNVAFTPDGTRLASAGEDGTVRIWNLAAPGRPPLVLTAHHGPALGVAYSPTGRELASSGHDGTIKIWDPATGTLLRTLRGHEASVENVVFSPDGTGLASASTDGTARVWSLRDPAHPLVLRGHGGTVEGITYSPDGRWLVTTGNDSTVRVWSSTNAVNPLILRGHKGTVWQPAFSPDGRQLATASDDGTVRRWDPSPPGHPVVLRGHAALVEDVAFSPDGRRLASASDDGTVRIWNRDGRGAPVVLRGHTGKVVDVAWSPDGRRVVTGGEDGTVRIWNGTGDAHPRVLRISQKTIMSVAFSPDGRRIVSGGSDRTVRVLSAEGLPGAGDLPVVLRGHQGLVRGVAFSPDGRRVASAGWDGVVRVWDSRGDAHPLVLAGHRSPVWRVAFAPDGRQLASSGSDGTVRIWDLTGRREPVVLHGHQGEAWDVAFGPDDHHVASSGSDGTLQIWDIRRMAAPLVFGGFGTSVEGIAMDTRQQVVATGHADATITVWRCELCGSLPQVRALAATRVTRALTADERRRYLEER